MNLISIKATTLPDAWFQAVYACLDQGRRFKIDQGSYAGQERLELDYVTIHIEQPGLRGADGFPLIPEMPEGCTVPAPVDRAYLADYAGYILSAGKKPGEQYSYGDRIRGEVYTRVEDSTMYRWTDQVAEVIRRAREAPRSNQYELQVAHPADLWLTDPPCLRDIGCRIQDGKLHFFIHFRSWDCFGGLPANLAGISMLHEYMASEIGVEMGGFVCNTKGLHLYDYVVELAKLRCGK